MRSAGSSRTSSRAARRRVMKGRARTPRERSYTTHAASVRCAAKAQSWASSSSPLHHAATRRQDELDSRRAARSGLPGIDRADTRAASLSRIDACESTAGPRRDRGRKSSNRGTATASTCRRDHGVVRRGRAERRVLVHNSRTVFPAFVTGAPCRTRLSRRKSSVSSLSAQKPRGLLRWRCDRRLGAWALEIDPPGLTWSDEVRAVWSACRCGTRWSARAPTAPEGNAAAPRRTHCRARPHS